MPTSFDRRSLLLTGAAAAFAGPVLAAPSRERFDAVVAEHGKGRAGTKTYTSLGRALDAAPADGDRPFRILVTAGTWREKLTVTKPNIHLSARAGRPPSSPMTTTPAAVARAARSPRWSSPRRASGPSG
jgi:pectin methylesterase-like acyl-CoA thioesterase